MKKIRIIGGEKADWSVDKDRKNLEYFLSQINSVSVTDSFWDAEIYFFVWADLVKSPRYFFVRVIKFFFPKKKIIAWVTNDISHPKAHFTPARCVDLFISPNSKVSALFEDNGLAYIQIPFYVSSKTFQRSPLDREALAKELKVNLASVAGKVLVGSFQRDSLGADLSQSKWQKNPELFISILSQFPRDEVVLVLAGPRRHYLVRRCEEEHIPYIFVGDKKYIDQGVDDMAYNNLDEKTVSQLYSFVDLYLITSESEGGPKAVLESSLTRTLICSTNVGLAPDFLDPNLLYTKDDTGNVFHILKMIQAHDPQLQSFIDSNYKNVFAVLNDDTYLNLIKSAVERVA